MTGPDATAQRLVMRGLRKSFAGTPVVLDVGFSVNAGEVIALLGANGAGKSTLVKMLCGIYTRDAGTILIDGRPAEIASPADAVAAGLRLIPQEISIHPDLTVAESISLANLPTHTRFGLRLIDRRAMRATAQSLLARLGLPSIAPDRRMGTLSLPEQRVVEIARALAGQARILIMDEPTAALSETEAELLFSVIGALKRDGVAIIYISHYLDEVFRLTDRIVVLRDGRMAGRFDTARTTREAVLEAMLGNRQGDLYPPKPVMRDDLQARLRVEALSLPGWLDAIALTLHAGEILGVFGLIGSGVEKLGRALFGAEPRARAASLTIDGRTLAFGAPAASVARGIGFVAAERKREGLVGILTVRENTTAPYLVRFVRAGQVDQSRERQETRHWIERLGVRAAGTEQEIRLLSGGNQQKICLARWLLGDVRVLILEEPTRGVDLGARRELYREIRALADRGVAVLVVSSDAEEVAGLADRSLVLSHGRVAARLDGTASAHALIDAASLAVAA